MSVGKTSLVALACLAFVIGCGKKEEGPTKPEVDETPDPGLVTFEENRRKRERELREMPLPQLAEAVASDSAQHVEPFNSAAVRELKGRGPEVAKELVANLREPDARSLLGLLTLLEVNPTVYRSLPPDFRYRVLTEGLKTAEFFNAWGVPHLFLDQPAGRAIVCEEPGIEKYLVTLLNDDRPALIWGGSELAEDAAEYNYRVKDYAWALILANRDQPLPDVADPGKRSEEIAKLGKQPPNSARARATASRNEICNRYAPQQSATAAAAD
jgi:hypothetical protein